MRLHQMFMPGIILLLLQTTHAQMDPVGDFNRHIASNWNGNYIRVSQYRVKGSPYFLGDSFPGIIRFKGGKVLADIKVLYNIYEQKAGMAVQDGIFEADEILEEFSIMLPEKYGRQELLFRSSTAFGAADLKAYLQVLEEGEKATLLKLYKARLAPDPANAMAKDLKVFDQYYEFFLYTTNGQQLKKIKLREKDFAKELEPAWVKQYVLEHKPDLSSEPAVIQMVQQYNR